ncbi:hypothetical protein L1987_20772 [Smallanthus sonchifolius]|uniref:Uncharacterized protein n=1 Tax=Smallanthus sonchifolius TaxID=185202 RepID=A0ACB9ITA4_9ASTR|nr:hypothetical protein L1987_20772 [Smallanthus sonchifolius]
MAGGADCGKPVVAITLDGHGCRCSGGRQELGERMSRRDERQQASGVGVAAVHGCCHVWEHCGGASRCRTAEMMVGVESVIKFVFVAEPCNKGGAELRTSESARRGTLAWERATQVGAHAFIW